MDVLTDILQTAGMNVRIGEVIALPIPYRIQPGPSEQIPFYAVAERACRLSVGAKSTRLVAGTVAFVNQGMSHALERDDSAPVAVISGSVTFTAGFQSTVFLGLPSILVLHPSEIVRPLIDAVTRGRPGWKLASEGLAVSLFVEALRGLGASNGAGAHGWLRGLGDNEIGSALRMMHERPAHPWTVEEFAKALSISRSAFAARFKEVTGRPPLAYLTWWRLHRAAAHLRRRDGATIAIIAREAGYESDVSFGKAFRREFGKPPGEVRREAAAGVSSPLQFELKKRTPFEIPEQETGLNLFKTAALFQREYEELFQHHGMKSHWYNVLRILRGEGTAVTKDEVLSRLVVPHSDPQTLFSGLIKAKLIKLETGQESVSITERGREALNELDEPLVNIHRRQLAHFSSGEMSELNRLLVKARRPDN